MSKPNPYANPVPVANPGRPQYSGYAQPQPGQQQQNYYSYAQPAQPVQQAYAQQPQNYYQPQQQQTFTQPGVQQQYPQQNTYNPPLQQAPQTQQSQDFNVFGSLNQQIGMQIGTQALQHGEELVKQNINKYVNIPHLKYYFNVSNSYVLYKLKLLLFPFRHKSWSRIVKRSGMNGQMEGYKTAREDLNAPDLYIPVMSFVTYVLLFGILLGSQKNFTPDVLGMTSTTALFIVLAEVLFMRMGLYVLGIPTEVPLLDLVSYSGYKFVGIIVTIISKILFPGTWYVYMVFGYSMICFGFFLLRSMKYIMFPDHDSNTSISHNSMKRRKVNFLFIIALIQVCMAWFMI